MDITLREYLTGADCDHDYVYKYGIALSIDVLDEKVKQLHIGIKNIQAVARRMADVSNIINKLKLYKKQQKRNANYTSESNTNRLVNPYPAETDHAVIRAVYPPKPLLRNIAEGVNISVNTVDTIRDIPVSHIYYVKDLKQYAINIDGIIIKGCLSSITSYQAKNTARCEYGIKCKSFIKDGTCTYYHEPEDYLKLNMLVPDEHKNTRNFTVGSWIHASNSDKSTVKNYKNSYFMRHIGNKSTLSYDLSKLKKSQFREEIANREGQLIHDLLIYMVLNNNNMLERYAHWV